MDGADTFIGIVIGVALMLILGSWTTDPIRVDLAQRLSACQQTQEGQ